MWSALGKVFKQLGSGIKKGVGEIGEVFGIGGDKAASELPVIGGTIGKTIPGGTPPFVATTPGTTVLGTVADLTRPALAQAPAIPAGLPVQTIGGDFQGVLPEIGRAMPPAPPPTGLPEIGGPGFVGNDPTLAGAAPETKEFRRTNLLDRLRELDEKDYSIEKDEEGNVTHRGKDRDRGWTTKDKVVSALIGWATGGLPGGVAAATDRNFMEKLGDQNERARLLPKIENQQKIAQREAQTQTIYEDDRRMRERDQEVRRKNQETEADRKRKQFRASNPYFDPATATDAQKRQLGEFGETPESIGSYDFSKSETKKIGGATFEKKMGKWVDSGLPQAPGEQKATMRLKDPTTGEVMEFETTSAKAAQMLNSRVVGQMAADAAADRQTKQQDFQARQNELEREARKQLAAYNAAQRAGNIKLAGELRERLVKLQQQLDGENE